MRRRVRGRTGLADGGRVGRARRARAAHLAALLAATFVAIPAPLAPAQGDPSAGSAVPIPPGQIDAAVDALDADTKELMARTGVPGVAVAVVHDDRVVYAKGFGVRRVGQPGRVDRNTVFQLASVSKPLGATAIARSVGRGRLRWNDPIVRYLPGFALSDPFTTQRVTIADMYAHRSGLPAHIGDLQEDMGYSQAEILRRLRFVPLSPGLREGYAYTNFGLTVAGLAAARAEHTSWPELSRRNIYAPLHMRSTSSRFTDFARARNRAYGHVRVGKRWVPRFVRRPDAQSPAGGASSSVADMAQWLRLVIGDGVYNGHRIIASDALREMFTPHSVLSPPRTPASRTSESGLGIDISTDSTGRVRYAHSGAFYLGAATNVTWVPSERLGIVALTNGQPVGLPEALTRIFLDRAILGHVERDWLAAFGPVFASFGDNHSRLAGRKRPAKPRPARAASAYTGVYANRYYGRLQVVRRGGGFVMRIGPPRTTFVLRHWNGDTFSYFPRGEHAVGISAVTFRFTRGRRVASAVNVEFLDPEGLGTFRRR